MLFKTLTVAAQLMIASTIFAIATEARSFAATPIDAKTEVNASLSQDPSASTALNDLPEQAKATGDKPEPIAAQQPTETVDVMTVREFQATVQGKPVSMSSALAANDSATSNSNAVATDAGKLRGAIEGLSIAQGSTATPNRKTQGLYLSGSAALSFRERSGESAVTFTDFKAGFSPSVAVGYRFGDFRADVEYTHFNHPVEAVSAAPTGRRPGDGKVLGNAFMFNLYYDIPIANSRLKPYVGAGIGTYSTRIRGLTNDTLAGFGLVVDNERSNNVFAFQVRAGLGYAVSDSVDLFLGYRYFGGNTITFSDTIFGTLKPSGAKLHNIEAGVRILF